MPAAQREFPYIWSTWLPRLLTGQRSCEWAIWFKACHQGWSRKPSDFNQADWLARHTALLNEHRDRWIQSGYEVRVENQNAFQLRGHSAILAGEIIYTDRTERVPQAGIDQGFVRRLVALIQRLSAPDPLRPPPARTHVDAAPEPPTGDTDDF